MVINVDERTLRVRFFYSIPSFVRSDNLASRYCTATIEEYISDSWIGIRRSVARCHPNDQYARKTGRKIALTRAIINLPKDVRTKIWLALFKKGMKP